MISEIVTFECDDQFQMVFMSIGNLVPDKSACSLPEGFGPDDVREALLATGHVRLDGDSLRITEFIKADELSQMLSAMLFQFESPGVPSSELVVVQASVRDYQSGIGSHVDIPLLAIAWLDFAIREDIADEARSSDVIWSKSKCEVEFKRHRDRRMKELVKRYSQPAARIRMMTPSSTALSISQESEFKVG